jgi:membrane protease YdiL (CAAX protease family)
VVELFLDIGQNAGQIPGARVKFFRSMFIEQVLTTGVVLAIWRTGDLPAAGLGLAVPRSWAVTSSALALIVGLLVWSSLKLRPKADKIREKFKDKVGALLPNSFPERRWFALISFGAGISEELIFRGFLLYYLSDHLPQLNTLEKILLISLSFGLAHIYQGRWQILSTGLLGLALAGLYWMTGSLLLPMLVHAAVDARILLIFPPPAPGASPQVALQSGA